jgi:hypothetical protein
MFSRARTGSLRCRQNQILAEKLAKAPVNNLFKGSSERDRVDALFGSCPLSLEPGIETRGLETLRR